MAANGIPDIPRPRSNDPETQRFYDAVSNAFRSIQRTDSQGLVTYDELGRRLLPLYNDFKALSSRIGGGENKCAGASVPSPVVTITTTGAFGVITLLWDVPIYRGHGHTEIWASKTPEFTDVDGNAVAEKIGDSAEGMAYFEHVVPAIEFTVENEYEVTRYYWLRHVSACAKGEGPWSEMVQGKTPASPTLIGELMSIHANDMMNALGLGQDLYESVVDAKASIGEARSMADDLANGLTSAAADLGAVSASMAAALSDASGDLRAMADDLRTTSDTLDELGTGVHTSTSVMNDGMTAAVTHMDAFVAEVGDSIAGVITQIETMATESKAEVDYSFAVLAETADSIAGLTETVIASATEAKAEVDYSFAVLAETADSIAGIQQTVTALATETEADLSVVTNAIAAVGDDVAGIREELNASVNAEAAVMDYSQTIGAQFNESIAGVITTIEATASENEAEVDYSFAVLAEATDGIAGVKETIEAEVTALGANVVSTEITFAEFDGSIASVKETVEAKADAESVYAMQSTNLTVDTTAGYSAIEVKAEVDNMGAKYAVQTDVNGYVQGFGLLNTGSPTDSGITFNVDNFYIAHTRISTALKDAIIAANNAYLATHSDVAAAVAAGSYKDGWEHYVDAGYAEGRKFSSNSTTNTTLMNNVATAYRAQYPDITGASFDTTDEVFAHIRLYGYNEGRLIYGDVPFGISGGKVYADKLFVKAANIEKLDVMDIALAGEVKSSNFVSGSSGWRINKAGDAELNSLVVRTGNLAANAVTTMVKDPRFYVQVVNPQPTIVNSVTVTAGASPMDVTIIWGGRCGYLAVADCQLQAYKNGSPWLDFGVVQFPSMDLPGWVASDTLAAGVSATYSATLQAASGAVQAEKVTLIAIGRMK